MSFGYAALASAHIVHNKATSNQILARIPSLLPAVVPVLVPVPETERMARSMQKDPTMAFYEVKAQILALIGATAVGAARAILGGTSAGSAATPYGLKGATLLPGSAFSALPQNPKVSDLTKLLRMKNRDASTAGVEWGNLRKQIQARVEPGAKGVSLFVSDEEVKQRKGVKSRSDFTYSKLMALLEQGGAFWITEKTRRYAMMKANEFAQLDYGVRDVRDLPPNARGSSRALAWLALATSKGDLAVLPPRPVLQPALLATVEALGQSKKLAEPIRQFILGWATGIRGPGAGSYIDPLASAPSTLDAGDS